MPTELLGLGLKSLSSITDILSSIMAGLNAKYQGTELKMKMNMKKHA